MAHVGRQRAQCATSRAQWKHQQALCLRALDDRAGRTIVERRALDLRTAGRDRGARGRAGDRDAHRGKLHGLLADGHLDLQLATTGLQQLDRNSRGARQRQCLLGQDAQRALRLELFRQRGAGRLQAGHLGQPVAHLAVQTRILEGDGDVVGQQLHHVAILHLEHARRIFGQHAKDADHLPLPPDWHG